MAVVPALDLDPRDYSDCPQQVYDLGQSADQRERDEAVGVNIEAEQALIGAVMYDNAAYQAAAYLKPFHFAYDFHADLWAYAVETMQAGRLFEPIAAMDRLKTHRAWEDLGGIRYLADLVDRAPPAANAHSFAEQIVDNWARRYLFWMLGEARAGLAQGTEIAPAGWMAELRHKLEQLEAVSVPDDAGLQPADELADSVLEDIADEMSVGKTRGLMTSLRCFDRRLGGLKPGWLVVLGARPSMGKTALARAAAVGAAKRNPHNLFAFFAIEMEKREILERCLSDETWIENGEGIAYQDIGNNKLTPMDVIQLRELKSRIPRNLIIDDASTVGLDDIVRKVWALKRRGPVGAVFIDYLQLMQLPQDRRGRNDAALWGEITSGLKRLARSAKVCIVLLSQLNRTVEGRDDKRPQLSDLRESGSIEQDANAVLFPYREIYYLERAEPKAGSKEHTQWEMEVEEFRNRLDVNAGKVRQGAVGTDRQIYMAAFDHIEDWRE